MVLTLKILCADNFVFMNSNWYLSYWMPGINAYCKTLTHKIFTRRCKILVFLKELNWLMFGSLMKCKPFLHCTFFCLSYNRTMIKPTCHLWWVPQLFIWGMCGLLSLQCKICIHQWGCKYFADICFLVKRIVTFTVAAWNCFLGRWLIGYVLTRMIRLGLGSCPHLIVPSGHCHDLTDNELNHKC